jgi:hypothetical protein
MKTKLSQNIQQSRQYKKGQNILSRYKKFDEIMLPVIVQTGLSKMNTSITV